MNAIKCYNIECTFVLFAFHSNSKKIRNKHAAFLSNEISSLGAIFDHCGIFLQTIADLIFMYLAAGMVVSKSFNKEQRFVVSADTRCVATPGKKENKWSRTCCLRTGKTQNLDSI